MTSTEQNTDLGMQVIAAWLDERGFKEAAIHLLEASDEVAQRVVQAEHATHLLEVSDEVAQPDDQAGEVEWLYYQHELKKERRKAAERRASLKEKLDRLTRHGVLTKDEREELERDVEVLF